MKATLLLNSPTTPIWSCSCEQWNICSRTSTHRGLGSEKQLAGYIAPRLEIIFRAKGSQWVEFNAPLDTIQVISEAGAKGKRGSTAHVGVLRVLRLSQAGVLIYEQMTAAEHVSSLLTTCSRLMYALRVLRNHGISAASMSDVFRATVLAKLFNSILKNSDQ